MLYGMKETVDDRITTVYVGADTLKEFENSLEVFVGQSSETRNWIGLRSSELFEHMIEDSFKGFRKQVICFFHETDEQRDLFVKEWDIQILKPFQARDRQNEMLDRAEEDADAIALTNARAVAEANGEEFKNQTIADLHGLSDENDPWDRRTEKEIEADKAMREKIKALQKDGKISSDSFGDAAAQKKAKEEKKTTITDDHVRITSVETTRNADGTITIDSAKARKYTDQSVDDEPVEEKKYNFNPEDFAAALAGDGSSDVFNVKSLDPTGGRGLGMDKPVFSEDAQAKIDEHRAIEDAKAKRKAEQIQRELDLKARQEREKGIFRGADLLGDDTIPWDDLPETIRQKLEAFGATTENIPVKNYPFNSEVGGKILIPCSTGYGNSNDRPFMVLLTENLDVKGTLSVGDSQVLIAERGDETKDGWVIIGRQDKKVEPIEGEEPGPRIWRPWAIKVRAE